MKKKRLLSNERVNRGGVLGRYKKIPTIFTLSGDIKKAANLRGVATKLLNDLSVYCGPSNIQAGAAAKKRYRLQNGAEITVEINFGRSMVNIFVPLPTGGGKPSYYTICPQLFRCFIFAIIDSVSPSIGDEFSTEDMDNFLIQRERFEYDVSFCYRSRYVSLINYKIRSAGAGMYQVGQYVLLGPAPSSSFQPSCCSDNRSLAYSVYDNPAASTKLDVGFLDIYPIHIMGDMIKKNPVDIQQKEG